MCATTFLSALIFSTIIFTAALPPVCINFLLQHLCSFITGRYVFADDTSPRYLAAALPVDYDTCAAADKFGNVFVARLPAEISQQVRHTTLALLVVRPMVASITCVRAWLSHSC